VNRRGLLKMAAGFVLAGASGCKSGAHRHSGATPGHPISLEAAPGVTVRAFGEGDALSGDSPVVLLDLDLAHPTLRVRVAADQVQLRKGRVFGRAWSLEEWCRRAGAVAGVNGGFFGSTDGEWKEILGMLATEGMVHSSGQMVRSTRNPGERYLRSVFGIGEDGEPDIHWAVGRRGHGALLTRYGSPVNPTEQAYWTVDSAVACGPRLIRDGRIAVSDVEERLVSDRLAARTFVGIVRQKAEPARLLLGVAESMRYVEAAAFLGRYCRAFHGTDCADAMCLDGGSSSQLVYRLEGKWMEARATPVTVPTAVLVFSG
jgi:hypothetical protein